MGDEDDFIGRFELVSRASAMELLDGIGGPEEAIGYVELVEVVEFVGKVPQGV